MARNQRQHFVFVKPCGCAVAVVEKHSGFGARDEDHAWRQVYGNARAQREAAGRGITCVLVDHATYVRDHHGSMLKGCTHQAVSA